MGRTEATGLGVYFGLKELLQVDKCNATCFGLSLLDSVWHFHSSSRFHSLPLLFLM